MRIRMTDKRERRLKRAMDAMGENTKAEAIDRALAQYLADLQNKEQIADELVTEYIEILSTPYLPLVRKTTVGEQN